MPGCQRTVPPAVRSPVNDTPLVVDEAMQIRDWDRSTNYYANGASVGGGTGYVWQTHEAIAPGHRRFVEAPVAVVNIVSMPVGVFVNPPWTAQVHRGETVPPTYTGQPPLPGESTMANGSAPEIPDTPGPSPAPETPTDLEATPAPIPAPPVIEMPVEPITPVTPVTPVEPVEPITPVTPVTPVEPVQPLAPADPPTPPAPQAPADPAAPVSPIEPAPPAAPVPPPPPPEEPAPVPQ